MKKLDGNVCDSCGKLTYNNSDLCDECLEHSKGKVDNFNLVHSIIPNYGVIFIQVISRNKDGGTGEVIKSYYVHQSTLFDYKDEIIKLCKVFNARAYIQLNPCSNKKVQWHMVHNLLNYLESGCTKITGILSEACGTSYDRLFYLVDVDDYTKTDLIQHLISQCTDAEQILIPTVSGWHIVTKPFNVNKFYQLQEIEHLDRCEVHKQAMTLLYCDLSSNSQ